MKRSLYFFDVDHTLTYGSTGRRFAAAATRRGVIKLRYLSLVPYMYALYRFGSGGVSLFERKSPAIRGVDKELLEDIGRDVFARKTGKALRPDMARLVESIKDDGGRVVLATSSFDFIVQPLADALGVEEVIASRLEYDGGRCTGSLAGSPVFGAFKRDAAAAYAKALGFALADCAFYSDSIHDLPLLLEVGEPVAVAPDRRLRREAEARGWTILESR
jgi:HAD-superfamily subfamily IB hydrolase, TIGR01490